MEDKIVKKISIAAAALALVASSLTAMPANAAAVSAANATTGSECAVKNAVAKGKGVEKSNLVCRVATIGSYKGALVWSYATDPILEDFDIMITAGTGGGFDTTGRKLGAAMKAEGLITGEPTYRNVTGASQTTGLTSFVNNDAGKAGKALIVGWATVGGVHTAKAAVKTSDAVPAASIMGEYQAVVVKKSSKYKTLKDLVADLKKNKKKLAIAGGSLGTIDHLTTADIFNKIGLKTTDMNYVPYSGGGQTATAVLSDAKVAAGIAGYGEFASFIEAGTMRILAVSSPKRVASIPAKTLVEQGVNVTSVNWRGISLPKGTSAAGRTKVMQALDTVFGSLTWKKTMVEQSWIPDVKFGSTFGNFIKGQEKSIPAALKSFGL
jgi:putative tricarboxylic transport membrane protein